MLSHLLNTSNKRISPATDGSEIAAGTTGTHVTDGTPGTSKEILAAGSTRESVILSNISDTRIDVSVGTAAVANKGIAIPAGATIELTPRRGCQLAINSTSTGASKNLAYQVTATA